jgi:ribonuclease R
VANPVKPSLKKSSLAAEGPLRDRVVSLLAETGKPVGVREMVRRLGLDSEARRDLKGVLRAMISDGEVVNVRGARVGLPARMNLAVGKLTVNAGGFGFVVPEKKAPREADIYVSAVNMMGAMHGDRVVARIERTTAKGAEGRVIRVLERATQRIVGRFETDGRFGGRVIPFDRRVLQELFIAPDDSGDAQPGLMVLAEITRPPTATRNPAGRVLAVLGRLEEAGVDLLVIMAKYGLPDAFPPDVEAEATAVPTEVRPGDIAGRTDFRPWDTVTVDPETARDHDDAISLDRLHEGGWRLAVHIADVAHYVRPGSLLDQEAYLRGTSVYFPDRVVPMLPHALSSNICSLVEGQERLTQTVVLDLDPRGVVKKTTFHDGVIKSRAKMSYQQVQKIVDGDAELRGRFAPLVPLFERMNELAKIMRKRRYERGSLDFDLPEPKLVLDAAGEMTAIVASERLDSMRVIEEFMLAANEAVARKLSDADMPALYRIHEQPDPERVEEFADLVASFGYRVPADLEGIRPQDFQLILRQIAGKPEEKLISYLLLRTMKLARYHPENLGHFGLATDMYAHFTSPIRRYPDLVVHRALRALREKKHPDTLRAELPAELTVMAEHLSDMERRATDAERELIEWKKVRFMADKLGETFKGYVTGVQSFGLFVELDEVYVQGLVHVSSMTDDYYQFNEKAHTLKGENTGKAYRLGDRVEVQVARVDLEQRKIDFALLDVLQRAAASGPARRRGGRSSERPSGRSSGRPTPPRRGGKPPRAGGRPARRRR